MANKIDFGNVDIVRHFVDDCWDRYDVPPILYVNKHIYSKLNDIYKFTQFITWYNKNGNTWLPKRIAHHIFEMSNGGLFMPHRYHIGDELVEKMKPISRDVLEQWWLSGEKTLHGVYTLIRADSYEYVSNTIISPDLQFVHDGFIDMIPYLYGISSKIPDSTINDIVQYAVQKQVAFSTALALLLIAVHDGRPLDIIDKLWDYIVIGVNRRYMEFEWRITDSVAVLISANNAAVAKHMLSRMSVDIYHVNNILITDVPLDVLHEKWWRNTLSYRINSDERTCIYYITNRIAYGHIITSSQITLINLIPYCNKQTLATLIDMDSDVSCHDIATRILDYGKTFGLRVCCTCSQMRKLYYLDCEYYSKRDQNDVIAFDKCHDYKLDDDILCNIIRYMSLPPIPGDTNYDMWINSANNVVNWLELDLTNQINKNLLPLFASGAQLDAMRIFCAIFGCALLDTIMHCTLDISCTLIKRLISAYTNDTMNADLIKINLLLIILNAHDHLTPTRINYMYRASSTIRDLLSSKYAIDMINQHYHSIIHEQFNGVFRSLRNDDAITCYVVGKYIECIHIITGDCLVVTVLCCPNISKDMFDHVINKVLQWGINDIIDKAPHIIRNIMKYKHAYAILSILISIGLDDDVLCRLCDFVECPSLFDNNKHRYIVAGLAQSDNFLNFIESMNMAKRNVFIHLGESLGVDKKDELWDISSTKSACNAPDSFINYGQPMHLYEDYESH